MAKLETENSDMTTKLQFSERHHANREAEMKKQKKEADEEAQNLVQVVKDLEAQIQQLKLSDQSKEEIKAIDEKEKAKLRETIAILQKEISLLKEKL